MTTLDRVAAGCRIFVGALFIFAAVMKLRDPQAFAFAINAFKIIPEKADHLAVVAAFVLPWLEGLTGLCLLLGFWTRSAALLISLMLLAFMGGISWVIANGWNVECSCFGKFELPCRGAVGACHLIRNTVLVLASGLVLFRGPGPLALDNRALDRGGQPT
jgi:uncharacterized membrane protein YphA (DoxX/SURF4 family)